MPWNQNIPQPNDQLSQSQADLLNNFQAIQTLVDVNHVDFNAGADQGKHKWVTFPQQAVDPIPPIAGTEIGLYNKIDGGQSELFINRPSDGTLFPLTKSNFANPGYTYLPSGLLMKWGNEPATNPSPQTIIYPAGGIPAFTAPAISILVMPTATSNLSTNSVRLNTNAGTSTALQFQVYHDMPGIAGDGFKWVAIGF